MSANALRWNGVPGHYEVYYLTATDEPSGVGVWIRYALRAPLAGAADCSLWFAAMDRRGLRFARRAQYPIQELSAQAAPFALTLAGADLTDRGMAGAFADVAWELMWTPTLAPAEHVHPMLARARLARTELVLAHPHLSISGTLRFAGRDLVLDGATGGQAHLWGSKHAARWAWAHAGALRGLEGDQRSETFVDGVSVYQHALGRQVGPTTPVVGRFAGEDFRSTSPLRVVGNRSRFGLTAWRFEARDGARRVVGEVDAPRETLVGVTYHDPDGDLAYCYNSEVASLRLFVWDRRAGAGAGARWVLRDTLAAAGTAHFEYAQRAPVHGVPLLVT